jgi:hypothetical protein
MASIQAFAYQGIKEFTAKDTKDAKVIRMKTIGHEGIERQ